MNTKLKKQQQMNKHIEMKNQNQSESIFWNFMPIDKNTEQNEIASLFLRLLQKSVKLVMLSELLRAPFGSFTLC